MRLSFDSWTDTFFKVGFRNKKRKKAKRTEPRRHKFELLEPRALLAGDLPVVFLGSGFLGPTEGSFDGGFEIAVSEDISGSGSSVQVAWEIDWASSTASQDDLSVTSGSVTLDESNINNPVWIDIQAVDDAIVEPTETFTITLLPGTGYTLGFEGELATNTLEIYDNDYAEGENTEDNPHFCTCPPEDGVSADVQNQVGTLITQVTTAASGMFANLIHLGSTVNAPVVTVDTSFGSEATGATAIEASLNFNGSSGPSVYYNPATISPGETYRFSLQPDTSSLPSGRYDWTIEVIEHYEDEYGFQYTQSRNFDGSSDIINRSDSDLGSGWSLRALDRLTVQYEGVQLIDGDGNDYWFSDNWDGTFTPQASDDRYTSLVTGYDSNYSLVYTLTDKRGNVSTFDSAGLLTSRDDRHGNTTTLSYIDGDGDGYVYELGQVTDPFGDTTTYTYADGNLATITDYAGRVTSLAYSGDLLTSVTSPDPDGAGPLAAAVTSFAYNAQSQIASMITDDGATMSFAYDGNGLISSVTSPDGGVTQYLPAQSVALVDTSTGIGSLANPATLVKTTDIQATITDPLGKTTVERYDRFGRPLEVTDAAGNTTVYERDIKGRIISVTLPPDAAGASAQYQYQHDAAGNLVQLTHPDYSSEQWTYDPSWNVADSYTDQLGRQTLFTIDPNNGDVLEVREVIGQVDDAQNGETDDVVTSFTYTSQGLLETVTDGLDVVTQYLYDSNGLLTDVTYAVGTAAAVSLAYEYDADYNLTAEVDALGNRTEYSYDEIGRLLTATLPDPDGVLTTHTSPIYSFVYDSLNRVVSETDPLNNTTAYTYTLGGLLDKITDALDGVVDFTYDLAGNLIGVTDELFRTTTYTYNNLGLLDTVTDAQSNVTTYAYDAVGNLTGITDALGNITSYYYDILGHNTLIVDALGGAISYAYDAGGQLLSATDQLYRASNYAYNELGLVDSVTDALGNVTSYAYDKLGNLTSVTLPQSSTGVSPVYSYSYDALGRLITETDPLGGVLSYAYDAAGNLHSFTDQLNRTTSYAYDNLNQLTSITDALSNVMQYGYDAAGNLTSVTDALNNTTTYAYDLLHRNKSTTDALGGVIAFGFDAAGQLTSQTDQLGNTATYSYDTLGQLSSVTDALYNTTSYAYDPLGNLTITTDALGNTTSYNYDALYRQSSMADAEGGVTSFTYDAVGNLLSLTDPVNNTTTWTYDDLNRVLTDTNELGNSRSFVYDVLGNVTERTDRNGKVREFDYDLLSRLTEERWIDGTTVLNTLEFDYDAASQLLDVSDANSAYAFTYDALGRRTSTDNFGTPGAPNVVLTSGFDAIGDRTSLSVMIDGNADFENLYTYDALLRMTSVVQSGIGILPVTDKRVDFSYNALGQFTGIDRHEDLTATVLVAASTYAYDTVGRLTNLDQNDAASATLAFYSWTYDSANRLTQISSIDGTTDYSYDATGQLTGAANSFTTDETYSYDANGNRITGNYVIGANNLVLSDGTFDYAYDAENNLIKKTNIATGDYIDYHWDHGGRLTSVDHRDSSDVLTKRVEFTYDVFNRKIGKQVDHNGDGTFDRSERYVYDDSGKFDPATGVPLDDIVYVFKDSDGPSGSEPLALSSRLLHGPAIDQILADEQLVDDLVDEVLWGLSDHLGTVRNWATYDAALDATTVANHLTFDSFGNITSQTDPTAIPLYAFTGREWDPDAELYYYRARWYDPALGRFVSDDPSGFAADDSNVQRYVGNSATNATDPSGLEAVWYKPWTWAEPWFGQAIPKEKDWAPLVRQHDKHLAAINRALGTKYRSIEDVPKRDLIKIGVPRRVADAVTDPRREQRRLLGQCDTVLAASETSLKVAAVADAAAGGLVGLELAGVTAVGSAPILGTGGATTSTALSAGARDVLARYGARPAAMAALAQLQAIRDALPRGGDAYIRLTARMDQFEAAIIEAFGR